MKMNKLFSIFVFFILLSVAVIAWTPPSDANFRNYYNLYNVKNANGTNATFINFYGTLFGNFTPSGDVDMNGYSIFNVTDVNATNANITNIDVTNIDVTNIDAISIDATDVNATNANITNIDATEIDTTNLSATNISAINISATNIDTTNLSATNISADNITGTEIYQNGNVVLDSSDEADLNVNSSNYWAGVSSFSPSHFYNAINVLTFNVTWASTVWCALTGCTMSGNIAMGSNDITGADTITATGLGTFDSLTTGIAATELYQMNQAVRTSDDVEFANITQSGNRVLDTTDEADLNVNSSTWWAGVSSFNPTHFSDIINVLTFNTTWANTIWCTLTGCTMIGDIAMGTNDITGAGAISATGTGTFGNLTTGIAETELYQMNQAVRMSDAVLFANATAQNIIRNGTVVDIRSFGAESNDGVSDQAALQAAINSQTENYSVYIPPGVWDVDDVTTIANTKINILIFGEGEASVIRLMDNSDTDIFVVDGNGDGTRDGIFFKDFVIDGNKANQGANGEGIYLDAYVDWVIIDNLHIYDTFEEAIRANSPRDLLIINNIIEDAGDDTLELYKPRRFQVLGNRIYRSNKHGIFADTNDDWAIQDGVVANNFVTGVISDEKSGIHIGGGQVATRIVVSGNIVTDATNTPIGINGIFVNADFSSITGNQIYDATGAGIEVKGEHISITGNTIHKNIKAQGTSSGISVNSAQHLTISGNEIYNTTLNGIKLDGTLHEYVTITGNTIGNSKGAGVKITADGGETARFIRVEGNTIYDDNTTHFQLYGVQCSGVGTLENIVISDNNMYNTGSNVTGCPVGSTYTYSNLVLNNSICIGGKCINQWSEVNGTGSSNITDVTGTAPIASSAGGTPDISLIACGNTEIYKYNTTSSAWECRADESSGGGGTAYDQSLNTTDAVVFLTVDTGQGANELYDMDQNVLEASDVTFDNITVDDIEMGTYLTTPIPWIQNFNSSHFTCMDSNGSMLICMGCGLPRCT